MEEAAPASVPHPPEALGTAKKTLFIVQLWFCAWGEKMSQKPHSNPAPPGSRGVAQKGATAATGLAPPVGRIRRDFPPAPSLLESDLRGATGRCAVHPAVLPRRPLEPRFVHVLGRVRSSATEPGDCGFSSAVPPFRCTEPPPPLHP